MITASKPILKWLTVIGVIGMLCGSCTTMGTGYDLAITDRKADDKLSVEWPDGLKREFQTYWALRFSRQAQKAFEMEAPYFQEAANFNRYQSFVDNTKQGLNEIIVESIRYENQRLVWINFYLPFGDEDRKGMSLTDEWLFWDGKWYHVLKDRLLFIELY